MGPGVNHNNSNNINNNAGLPTGYTYFNNYTPSSVRKYQSSSASYFFCRCALGIKPSSGQQGVFFCRP